MPGTVIGTENTDKYKHTDSFVQTHPVSFISETFTESQLQWRHKQLCTDG